MKIQNWILLFLISALFSLSAYADQFYGGFGLNSTPGQPNMEENRIPISLAYETKTLWRFSLTDTVYQYTSSSKALKSQILCAERIWVYKIRPGFSLIGAFGPGYYMTKLDGAGSGSSIGIAATGSVRYAMSEQVFFDAAMHFKNSAVPINDISVNGGYQGLFLNIGYFF